MSFPHLPAATTFPRDNAHVYEQYANNFDYAKWQPNTKLQLLRVKWHADRHDIPDFETMEKRDAWITAHTGDTVTLNAMCYLTPDNTIKLPIPLQTLQKYNYLVVTMPPENTKLPHAETDITRTFCYFLTDLQTLAPNTTMCALDLDSWTTWRHTLEMSGILARGHAPLARVTPEKFLVNPLENNAGLLAPDVNYGGDASRIAHVQSQPLQTGERHIFLVCAFSLAQLREMAAHQSAAATDTAPTYSDNDESVQNWTWAGTGKTPTGDALTTAYGAADGMTATPYVYRLSGIGGNYFDNLARDWPHIMAGIITVFVATDDMATSAGNAVRVGAADWQPIIGARKTLADVKLTPAMFDFPDEIRDVAKLYTSPYSALEITDNWGSKTRVAIQDTGKLSIKSVVTLGYPILRQMAWLDGIGATGDTNITVNTLTATTAKALPNSDALAALISRDIPTYTLMRDTADKWTAENHARAITQARQNAIISHTNTASSANTGLNNANINGAASRTITARGNTLSNDVTKQNNTVSNNLTNKNNTKLDDDNSTQQHKMAADLIEDSALTTAAYGEGQNQSFMSAIGGAAITVGGVVGGLALGAATGGIGALGAAAALGTTVNAGLQGYNTSIAMTKESALFTANLQTMLNKETNAENFNDSIVNIAKTYATDVNKINTENATKLTELQNNANTDNTNTSVNASIQNANNTRATTINNNRKSMENARDTLNNTITDLRRTPPTAQGASGGDNFMDIAGDAMTVKIVTQSVSALIQAGREMQRYGIMAGTWEDMSELVPTKHFAFWQMSDMWLNSDKIPDTELTDLRDMFTHGVTVWRDPDMIGNVQLSDNLKG